jgi:hypothetical protein
LRKNIFGQDESQKRQYRKYGKNVKLGDYSKMRTGLVLSRKEAKEQELISQLSEKKSAPTNAALKQIVNQTEGKER